MPRKESAPTLKLVTTTESGSNMPEMSCATSEARPSLAIKSSDESLQPLTVPDAVEIPRKVTLFRVVMERKLGLDWEHSEYDESSLQTNQVQEGYDAVCTQTGEAMSSISPIGRFSGGHGHSRGSLNEDANVLPTDLDCREDMQALGRQHVIEQLFLSTREPYII